MTSKIKVDNITDQGGNELIKRCGSTTTLGSGSGNTINVCGSAITLGRSGGTVSLASGATQSGFGRTGTVDWQTGSIKTATFTAANGEGYFADTSSGAFTMNLPAGTAGAIVAVADYTRTFQTENLTITPNGSQKIGGVAASLVASTEGQSLTLVYVDDTEGWINTSESTGSSGGLLFIEASGGTITEDGNFKVHTFTGPGTFTVTRVSSTYTARNTVGYLVIGGGGAGGTNHGGGGGAGGFREGRNAPIDNFTASPLVANAPTNAITVTAQAYPIVVGGGGSAPGGAGNVSTFDTITSAGGGGGGSGGGCGSNGGSGGGAGGQGGCKGTGNTPPVSPAQGKDGGCAAHPDAGAGGGGGATVAGGLGQARPGPGGPGGAGASSSITGASVARGGGGGGGNGGGSPFDSSVGTDNTGGGGGGGANPAISAGTTARNGGSGIVVIRYKFQ